MAYIWLNFRVNVGKYTSPMDAMGLWHGERKVTLFSRVGKVTSNVWVIFNKVTAAVNHLVQVLPSVHIYIAFLKLKKETRVFPKWW